MSWPMWFQAGMMPQSSQINDRREDQVESERSVALPIPRMGEVVEMSGKLAPPANSTPLLVGNGRPSNLCMCQANGNASDPIKSRLEQRVSVLLVANEQLLHSPLSPSANSRHPKIRFRQPSVDLEVSPSVSGASELSPDFPSEPFSSSEESESSPEASEERPISYTDLTSTTISHCRVAPMSVQNGGTKIVRYKDDGEDVDDSQHQHLMDSHDNSQRKTDDLPEGKVLDELELEEEENLNESNTEAPDNVADTAETEETADVAVTHDTSGTTPFGQHSVDSGDQQESDEQTAVKENENDDDTEVKPNESEEGGEADEETVDPQVVTNEPAEADRAETDEIAVETNEEDMDDQPANNSEAKKEETEEEIVVNENEEETNMGKTHGGPQVEVEIEVVAVVSQENVESSGDDHDDYQIIQDSPEGEENFGVVRESESAADSHSPPVQQVSVVEEEVVEKLSPAELFASEDHLVSHLVTSGSEDGGDPSVAPGVLAQSLTESEVTNLAVVASAPESRTGEMKPPGEEPPQRRKSVEPEGKKKSRQRGATQSPAKRPLLVPKPPEGQLNQTRMSRKLRAVHSTAAAAVGDGAEPSRSRAKSHSPAKGPTPKFLYDHNRPSLEAIERHKRREEEKKTAEDMKLAEEKEKKRKEAEDAFKSWLRRKNEELRRAKSTEREPPSDSLTAEIKAKRKAEAEAAFQAWLERKAEEQREKRRLQAAITNATEKGSKEEAEEAFRSWKDRKKIQSKLEKQLEGAKQRELDLIVPIGSHESKKAKRQKSTDGVVLPKIRNLRLVSPGGKKTSKAKSLPMINGVNNKGKHDGH